MDSDIANNNTEIKKSITVKLSQIFFGLKGMHEIFHKKKKEIKNYTLIYFVLKMSVINAKKV